MVNFAPAWIATDVKKPSFTAEAKEHPFLNHFFKYPGRIKWNEVTLKLVDPVDPDAAMSVWRAIEKSGYHLPETEALSKAAMVSKRGSVDAMGNFAIQQLTPDPTTPTGYRVVETWELVNPIFTDVNFGELSYEGEDLTTIELTINYDYARLRTAGVAYDHDAGLGF